MSVTVSVIVAAYNAQDTLGDALTSLVDQRTSVPYEVVVVDDGSTDGTWELLQEWVPRGVTAHRLPENEGRSAARNRAIELSTGPILVPCDADDMSLEHRIQSHVQAFERHPEASVVGGQVTIFSPRGDHPGALDFPRDAAGVDRSFRRGRMGIAHGASAFRRDWFTATGGYDPRLRWCEDYDLFARGWEPGRYVPDAEVLLRYRRPSARVSWRHWWQNERHRRAINLRIQDSGRVGALAAPIEPHLLRSSSGTRRSVELLRYTAITARGLASRGTAGTSGAQRPASASRGER